jgi:hypothetical protein
MESNLWDQPQGNVFPTFKEMWTKDQNTAQKMCSETWNMPRT